MTSARCKRTGPCMPVSEAAELTEQSDGAGAPPRRRWCAPRREQVGGPEAGSERGAHAWLQASAANAGRTR